MGRCAAHRIMLMGGVYKHEQKLCFVSWVSCASDAREATNVNYDSRAYSSRPFRPDTTTSIVPDPCPILTFIPGALDILNLPNANPLHSDAFRVHSLLSWSFLIVCSALMMILLLHISRHNPAYVCFYLPIVTSSDHVFPMFFSLLQTASWKPSPPCREHIDELSPLLYAYEITPLYPCKVAKIATTYRGCRCES